MLTNRRCTPRRLPFTVFALAAALTLTIAALDAALGADLGGDRATSTAASRAEAPPPVLREVPNDPPGVPARPVPGAPPAPVMRFGRAVTHQVNVDMGGANIPGDAANEPSIAVNPLAPNKMAVGWRQFDTINSDFRQAGHAYTTDGGRTWTFPGVLDPGVFRSDPVLTFDVDGGFYYSSLKSNYLVDVWSSTDYGATWGQPVDAWGGDKQWINADRSGGVGTGNLYQWWSTSGSCCGNRTFTRSTDGGQSFETPIQPTNNPVWGTLDVAPDGTLYIAGVNIYQRDRFYVDRSDDAQIPGVTPTFQSTIVDMGGPLVAFGGSGSPNPDGLHGQVWIAVDPSSGPTAGWIYMLASVDPAGTDPLDVHFVRSTDGGATWSAPVRVNDDPQHDSAWQWFGTMSVAPTGRIDAIWNDTRDSLDPTISALYYSYSEDGGFTWSPNERLSDFFDSHVGFPRQNKIGDYCQMISDAVGASLAWAATFNGEQDVYYTRIGDYDCNVNGVPDSLDVVTGTSPDTNGNGIPDECEDIITAVGGESLPDGGGIETASAAGWQLYQNAPNPFNPATTIRFDARSAAARVRLTVYDADGRFVRTLANRSFEPGEHAVEWDGRDARGRSAPSGLYYYRLESGGRAETRAMLLVK